MILIWSQYLNQRDRQKIRNCYIPCIPPKLNPFLGEYNFHYKPRKLMFEYKNIKLIYYSTFGNLYWICFSSFEDESDYVTQVKEFAPHLLIHTHVAGREWNYPCVQTRSRLPGTVWRGLIFFTTDRPHYPQINAPTFWRQSRLSGFGCALGH